MWCIPPKQNAEFVSRMDEKPFQLLDEMLEPIAMSGSNHVKKYDCEYIRKGSCSIFMFTEPLGQWREAHALPHRTSGDWAQQMKCLIDEAYPDAEKIVLVMDNLNTHTPASFYKAFSPEEAFRLTQKLEIHYTPKHGSWLDIAETELSALTIQCLLGARIPSVDTLNRILSSWSQKRNTAQKGVSWQFTTADARVRLKHLYPEIRI